MSTNNQFTEAVRAWAEVFMHRSMRDFGRFMHVSGLSMPQVNTLMRLYYQESGGASDIGPQPRDIQRLHNYYQEACGVSEIGRELGISTAAASQMIERMVQQGLLERSECAGDRRIRQVSLTVKGRGLVQQAIEARHHWLTQLPAHLTREQQAAIAAGLACLTEAAQNLEDFAPASDAGPRKATAIKRL
jgi:DNA-binding MarR family transcriptional regulator